MKLGTQIIFADSREATVVYNGLDGVGIKWGLHDPDPADFEFNPLFGKPPDGFQWFPDAMLRRGYKGERLPCVDMEYTVKGGDDVPADIR